jgi:hypothetical protein
MKEELITVWGLLSDGSHTHYCSRKGYRHWDKLLGHPPHSEPITFRCLVKHHKPLKFLEKVALVEGGIILAGAGAFFLVIWLSTK